MNAQEIVQTAARFLLFLGVAVLPPFAVGQPDVLTQHNDNARTGLNFNETTLTPANVNVNQFGLLFKLTVDDQVYAQPLYVAKLAIGGGIHNVVYVATVNNSVYAFDADAQRTPYWQVNLGTAQRNSDAARFCSDIAAKEGIIGTPVIDRAAGVLYIVAATNDSGIFHQKLHALDIATGTERPNSPATIQTGGFDPLQQNQRAALLLLNGVVYIGFGSHCDYVPYGGYLFAYRSSDLTQIAVFNTAPHRGGAAIWQAGQGPSTDGTFVYLTTGNGSWDGVTEFSESFLKFDVSAGLTLADWFTPASHAQLDAFDYDLGSTGPLLLPGTNPAGTSMIVHAGKDGVIRLLNRDNLGHLGDSTLLQSFAAVPVNGNFSSIVYWNSSRNGPTVYLWSDRDYLRSFSLKNGLFEAGTPGNGGSVVNHPGGALSLSSNGASNGIVWANTLIPSTFGPGPGELHAFDADQLGSEIYNNRMNAARDSCGNHAKFAYPTVTGGKVYLPSFGNQGAGTGQLCVYGLLSPPPDPPAFVRTITASDVTVSWSASNGTTSYNVKQSSTTAGPYAVIGGGVTGTSYATPLPAGPAYFAVSAVNANGESPNSAPALNNAYLVGDAVPRSGTGLGTFGDLQVNALDLIAVLRAVTGIPGATPPCGSDLFDAMDAFPLDSDSARGGDGLLNILDLVAVLRRTTGVDPHAYSRTPQARTCPGPEAQLRGVGDLEGTLRLGTLERTVDGAWSTAVYLQTAGDIELSGLAFAVGSRAGGLAFLPASVAPSLVDTALDGKIAVAWLKPLHVRARQRLLLGYLRSGQSDALTLFGVSANAAPDGRAVHLTVAGR